MGENRKTLDVYNEHVTDIQKIIDDTYGGERRAMAYAITSQLISPVLLMRHFLTGELGPDPEYVMFILAKDLTECQVVKGTFSKYLTGLKNPDKMSKLLDEAMELTENAGFGDISY